MRKWPTQVSTVVVNVGRELSSLKMGINMANADYPSFFLWNELEPRCQQRAAGSLELCHDLLRCCHDRATPEPRRSIEKKWRWEFYPAAQNFTNRMLFWNTHTFKTIWLLWKRYHLIHRSSIFSTIQWNNQQSARNTSYVCNYAVRSCGTWRKGPGQSPRNVLSISDLELYVTERNTGVCDPVTNQNVGRIRRPLQIANMAIDCV